MRGKNLNNMKVFFAVKLIFVMFIAICASLNHANALSFDQEFCVEADKVEHLKKGAPLDLSGRYTQCIQENFGKKKVLRRTDLNVNLIESVFETRKVTQTYAGSISFAEVGRIFGLVNGADDVHTVPAFFDIEGSVVWEFNENLQMFRAEPGFFIGTVRPLVGCGWVYPDTINLRVDVDDISTWTFSLPFEWHDNGPCEGETTACIEGKGCFPIVSRDDANSLAQPLFGGTGNQIIPQARGSITVQLSSSKIVATKDNNDIQQASVTLFKQTGFIRAKKPDETEKEFEAFLKDHGRTQVSSKKLKPIDKGRYDFLELPIFDTTSTGASTSVRPIYYTVEVTNAETEEIVPDIDDKGGITGDKTETLYFSNSSNINIRPDIDIVKASLLPFDGIGVKLELIEALGTSTFSNYIPIENDAKNFVEELVKNPENKDDKNEKFTPEVQEALKRAIWAERVTLDGARFSDKLLEIMLNGLATVIADLFDDVANFAKDGKTAVDKKINETQGNLDKFTKQNIWEISNDPLKDINRLEKNLKRLSEVKGLTDKLDSFDKSFKLLSIGIASVLNRKNDKEFIQLVQKGLNILSRSAKAFILSGASGKQGVKGGLQGLIKIAIEESIKASKPLILDNSILPSYTKGTAPFLKDSVDKFKKWNTADPSNYSRDRNEVAEILGDLNDKVTIAILDAEALQDAAGWLDLAQDGLGAINNVTNVPMLKVIEKVVQASKYINNARSVIIPFSVVFGDAQDLVQKGTLKAFGDDAPTGSRVIAAGQSGVLKHSGQPNRVRINRSLFDAIPAAVDGLADALNRISENLKADNIGAALELSGGDGPDGYINNITELDQAISFILTQVSGLTASSPAGAQIDSFTDLIAEDLKLKTLEIQFEERITDLFVKIFTIEFEGPQDPLYIADRNNVLALIDSTVDAIKQFETSLDNIKAVIAEVELLPAIAVQNPLIVSKNTGGGSITESPEEFTFSVKVKNLSETAVSGLSAKLTVLSPNDSVTASPSPDAPIEIGALEADDGAKGAGADETTVEWTLTYEGNFSSEAIFIIVNILENGDDPFAFVTNEIQDALVVAPAKADKDLDFMPDDWENDNGLDDTKDDSMDDADNDGVINIREFKIGTDPQNSDTDNDGLSDGDELSGKANGIATDPLNADSDNDGEQDGTDGQPLDGGSTDKPNDGDVPGEPEISIDKTIVNLDRDEPSASVIVSNSGKGNLTWSAISDNESIAVVSPKSPDFYNGKGFLLISAPDGYDFDTPGKNIAVVKAFDVTGADKDFKEIMVKVGTGKERKPPVDVGTPTPEPEPTTGKPTPEPTTGPTPAPKPPSGKSFTFNCDSPLSIGNAGIETLNLKPGESETCVLKLVNAATGVTVNVATDVKNGFRQSSSVEPGSGVTDENMEMVFSITGLKRGRDWIGWAVPNDKGDIKFNKRAYDAGRAWGMFVEVK